MSGNELILNNGKHVFQFSGSNSEIERRIRLHLQFCPILFEMKVTP